MVHSTMVHRDHSGPTLTSLTGLPPQPRDNDQRINYNSGGHRCRHEHSRYREKSKGAAISPEMKGDPIRQVPLREGPLPASTRNRKVLVFDEQRSPPYYHLSLFPLGPHHPPTGLAARPTTSCSFLPVKGKYSFFTKHRYHNVPFVCYLQNPSSSSAPASSLG